MITTNKTVTVQLNGQRRECAPGESILTLAKRVGVEIPHLCFKDGLATAGNCRACVVEIQGERTLAPSCCRTVSENMVIESASPRAERAQKLVLELLQTDARNEVREEKNELTTWSRKMGVTTSRFPARSTINKDQSHPAIQVNLDACILCTRCVRACRETQVNDVIGLAFRGSHAQIVFDMKSDMGDSTCVACGECVQACPTGALLPANPVAQQIPEKTVDSVCPYCGVGCQLSYQVKDNTIISVEGRDGPANHQRLCVKGRYGFDYAQHPQRLRTPLIRRADAPKRSDMQMDPERIMDIFREATWDEALALAAGKLKSLRDTHGKASLAGFGSAKGSNEEAYLFQKLVRIGFGTNNVDHCTRLCHASSVAALLEGIGSGAVSNPVMDVDKAEVIIVIGANPTVNHPVGATWIKNAVKNGAKLIVCDPRRSDMARMAHRFLQFHPDTDVAMLNAMMHVIIEEDLLDHEFIKARTTGFEAIKENVKTYTPEAMAPICGIPAETLREVARLYATSKGSMILWGMGVSQHIHGTDNVRCLIALALMTGQIGKPGAGLHPLRGQNNVQGASDAGLIPMMFPDYQRVVTPGVTAKFELAWKLAPGTLDTKPGLTVVEVMHAIQHGDIRGMYIMGENPAMSDPDVNHARDSLSKLEHLVVQDIFFTETAYYADVILPASAFPEKTGSFTNTDRTVQLGRQAIDPPGDAKQDLWIIQQMGHGLGLDWNYQHVSEVFEEMRHTMPSIAGISWKRLENEGAVTYPCLHEEDMGQAVVFTENFPTADGRAKFVAADLIHAAEKPDSEYPMVLITGRQLEHWHTGSMTRRASVLDAIEPDPIASIHADDLAKLGGKPGDLITLESRRGQVSLYARVDNSSPRGAVFVPFCYYEAAINRLTNAALDPFGKIPEFKYCAIKIHLGGTPPVQTSFGGGQAILKRGSVLKETV
ncbi:formate dehydrogenase subunit alpha [Undibacterium sp. LX40W]|uniref:Formate dehydrogenase subunit alpha n=1 Tax=Undibacterium nitidum TaxID=2762298 RepID=A0A923HP18_9BURK|nr:MULTISPECIES: formate dehydrogenase subunit alpha [Undibacterium]MBC3881243.1 formate dehydrogenase subunit alpha [Undibacterium nitidum]MBC3891974.1 formate dehydrogenase subunit alpha [Undibacterium sp. LX40W]